MTTLSARRIPDEANFHGRHTTVVPQGTRVICPDTDREVVVEDNMLITRSDVFTVEIFVTEKHGR